MSYYHHPFTQGNNVLQNVTDIMDKPEPLDYSHDSCYYTNAAADLMHGDVVYNYMNNVFAKHASDMGIALDDREIYDLESNYDGETAGFGLPWEKTEEQKLYEEEKKKIEETEILDIECYNSRIEDWKKANPDTELPAFAPNGVLPARFEFRTELYEPSG